VLQSNGKESEVWRKTYENDEKTTETNNLSSWLIASVGGMPQRIIGTSFFGSFGYQLQFSGWAIEVHAGFNSNQGKVFSGNLTKFFDFLDFAKRFSISVGGSYVLMTGSSTPSGFNPVVQAGYDWDVSQVVSLGLFAGNRFGQVWNGPQGGLRFGFQL
jgi:hypothetical protein